MTSRHSASSDLASSGRRLPVSSSSATVRHIRVAVRDLRRGVRASPEFDQVPLESSTTVALQASALRETSAQLRETRKLRSLVVPGSADALR